MTFLRLLTMAAAVWPAAAFAAADPAAISLKFADDYAVPRFQALARATHVQADAWAAACAAKRPKADALRKAYVGVSEAWSNIEYIHIGPAAVALRAERFNWWIDKTNATGKALDAMLAADPATLTPEKLATGSVAGQGLPIVERLLYAKGAKLDTKRCAVGAAVARGQAAIADGIVADWTAPDGTRAALAANTRWRFAFADAKEAASVIMTDLVAGLESLKDFKVARVFHDDTNAAAPRMAEAAIAGRSLVLIRRNLAAIHEGLQYFLADATDAQKYQLDTAFADAEKSLDMLEKAKGEKLRTAAAQRALAAFSGLSQQAMAILPAATGLTLGFNNLDGD
jgi:uncharacterized protein